MSEDKKTSECIELKQLFEELLLLRDKYGLNNGLISIDDFPEVIKSLAEEGRERVKSSKETKWTS